MIASTGNSSAKKEILAAIRGHLAASAPFDRVHEEHHSGGENSAEETSVHLESASHSLAEMFRENLESVGGKCRVVSNSAEALAAVREIINLEKPERIAISNFFLSEEIKAELTGEVEILDRASKEELFNCGVGITGAQWGIAETGTLVLESDGERNRLASLVPPVHIALIEAGNIRQRMPEILELVSGGGDLSDSLSPAITFITGPSRTSDIELTLAIGVHGPRELHVIIIAGTNL